MLEDTILIIAAALVNLLILQKDPNGAKAMWEPSENLVCRDLKLHWSLLGTIY